MSTVTPGVHAGFRVTYDGQQTGCVPWDDADGGGPSSFAARLTALSSMTSATVSKTTYNTNGRRYTVTITDSDDIIKMESPATCGTFSSGTPSITITAAGGLGTHTGGQHFKLTFDTSVTDTNNATIGATGQQRRRAPSIGKRLSPPRTDTDAAERVDQHWIIGRHGTRSTTASNEGYVWTVTFSGTAVQGNVPLLSVTDDNLGSGNTYDDTHSLTIATTTVGIHPGFVVTYSGESTTCLPWAATASQVDAALEGLSTVTSVSVSGPLIYATTGRRWTVKFESVPSPPTIVIESMAVSNAACGTFVSSPTLLLMPGQG